MKKKSKIKFEVDERVKDIMFNAILNHDKFAVTDDVLNDNHITFSELKDFVFWSVKPQDTPITRRAVCYLMTYRWLTENYNGGDNPEINGLGTRYGGDGYIHHDIARSYCKKYYYNIDFTSYTKLGNEVYSFITPKVKMNNLIDRDGTWKPTQMCIDFLTGKISVPDRIIIIKNKIVWVSPKHIKAHQAPKIAFKEAVEIYNQIVL